MKYRKTISVLAFTFASSHTQMHVHAQKVLLELSREPEAELSV